MRGSGRLVAADCFSVVSEKLCCGVGLNIIAEINDELFSSFAGSL